jgi:uncharacterized membrane protein
MQPPSSTITHPRSAYLSYSKALGIAAVILHFLVYALEAIVAATIISDPPRLLGLSLILASLSYGVLLGLLLLSMYYMSRYYGDEGMLLYTFYSTFILFTCWTVADTAIADASRRAVEHGLSAIVLDVALILAVGYLSFLLSTLMLYEALRRASMATGNNYFKTAGILMLIGSLIPLGGYIAYIAGLVVLLLAFYTLKII